MDTDDSWVAEVGSGRNSPVSEAVTLDDLRSVTGTAVSVRRTQALKPSCAIYVIVSEGECYGVISGIGVCNLVLTVLLVCVAGHLYNWSDSAAEIFAQHIMRLVSWCGVRMHVLNGVLHQKMGLFAHTPPPTLVSGSAPAGVRMVEVINSAFPPPSVQVVSQTAAASTPQAPARLRSSASQLALPRATSLMSLAQPAPPPQQQLQPHASPVLDAALMGSELRFPPPPPPIQRSRFCQLVDPVMRQGTLLMATADTHRQRREQATARRQAITWLHTVTSQGRKPPPAALQGTLADGLPATRQLYSDRAPLPLLPMRHSLLPTYDERSDRDPRYSERDRDRESVRTEQSRPFSPAVSPSTSPSQRTLLDGAISAAEAVTQAVAQGSRLRRVLDEMLQSFAQRMTTLDDRVIFLGSTPPLAPALSPYTAAGALTLGQPSPMGLGGGSQQQLSPGTGTLGFTPQISIPSPAHTPLHLPQDIKPVSPRGASKPLELPLRSPSMPAMPIRVGSRSSLQSAPSQAALLTLPQSTLGQPLSQPLPLASGVQTPVRDAAAANGGCNCLRRRANAAAATSEPCLAVRCDG